MGVRELSERGVRLGRLALRLIGAAGFLFLKPHRLDPPGANENDWPSVLQLFKTVRLLCDDWTTVMCFDDVETTCFLC